ncbi:MAG TPA: anaerobic carbon-monoxide dehydrogenase catalytic subunit [bacterium]|nr:anaerobic carbon-monoxide dehydrogenase catalytic subunit [bacterium]
MAEEKAKKKEKKQPQEQSACEATCEMLGENTGGEYVTVFDRSDSMEPRCKFGSDGVCCRICAMGPCRIIPDKPGKDRGVCGATVDTIAARNFIRMIAGGAAAHSDHGRAVCETLLEVAEGKSKDYTIKDEQKTIKVAMDLGIEVGERPINEIAADIARAALAEFGNQHGELKYLSKAPLKRQKIWRDLGVAPRGIDREVVEIMHRTHMGVDHEVESLLMQGARCSLADGWGGSMLATDLQDILFGTPEPIISKTNLGCIDPNMVNVIVHGHEPLLSEMIVAASQSEDMINAAKAVGAEGINIGGICCTANEILMRHGIPPIGNFITQELAVSTGAVDAMIVDVQCVFPSLPTIAKCFNTAVITTSKIAKMDGARHIQFDEHNALATAKKIIMAGVEMFKQRPANVHIPQITQDFVGGFSHESINYLLGGTFRASYKPLNDNIINGLIRGVAGVVGCNNPKVKHDWAHLEMIKELLKNDVLVLTTGCGAIAAAKAGLCSPEAAAKYCGEGLRQVCETVGLPPVIHMGSCVDNSRILIAATAMVKEGGLGDDLSDLPAVGAAPEWMSEKAISIGQYFVASGVYTVFGTTFPTLGAQETTKYLFEKMDEKFGGCWAFEPDPIKAAQLMIARIDAARKKLGIDKARERVLFDMEKRRELA